MKSHAESQKLNAHSQSISSLCHHHTSLRTDCTISPLLGDRPLTPVHERSRVPTRRGRRSVSWPSPWPPTRASAPTAGWAAWSPATSSATSSAPGASVRSRHHKPAPMRSFVAPLDHTQALGLGRHCDGQADDSEWRKQGRRRWGLDDTAGLRSQQAWPARTAARIAA